MASYRRERSQGDEEQMFTRLFILGDKEAPEEEYKEAFGKFGKIDDLFCVKDRVTRQPRGITYITYSKPSEAALALEEMNGQPMGSCTRPLKVILSSKKQEGNQRDENEHEKMMRIFIMVSTEWTEANIKEAFKEFGDVESIKILKNRDNGTSRGLAFVKFYRAYHAALAFENCDKKFKAQFADDNKRKGSRGRESDISPFHDKEQYNPRYVDRDRDRYSEAGRRSGSLYDSGPGRDSRDPYHDRGQPGRSSYDRSFGPTASSSSALDVVGKMAHNNSSCLIYVGCTSCTEEQMYRLFNIAPGLERHTFNPISGTGRATYQSPQCAAWALEKLNNFEYPLGFALRVTYDSGIGGDTGMAEIAEAVNAAAASLQCGGDVNSSIQFLAQAVQKASSLNTTNVAPRALDPLPGSYPQMERLSYCSTPLPLQRSLSNLNSPCAERLFIVSQPEAFPEKYLRDCFQRFGDLIEVYFVSKKNFGYAKFASKEAARNAVETLHGQYICEMRVKVMVAEPESGPKRRSDYDDHNEGKRFKRD